ncbi:unnamed protein product [Clonostachys rosea f. rosea IK726]|uniref:Uncharacterized protein n=1 Tax=Clonostachys rosea f. rosea IK726 TaxID=1349383 RepID=A0ACA9UMX9_BIOOC|nr:unnamed protein product [Clonostachys rosea f. rosea IK726]
MTYIKPDPDVAGIGVVSSAIAVGALLMVLSAIKIMRELWEDINLTDLFRPRAALAPNSGQWVTVKDAKDVQERVSILDLTIFSLANIQLSVGIATAVAAIAKHDILVYHYWVSYEICWLVFLASTAGFTITTSPFMVSNLERNIVRTAFIWCLLMLTLYLFFRIDDTLALNEKAYSQPGHWSKELPTFAVDIALLIHNMVCQVLQTLWLSRENLLLVDYYIKAPLNHISRLLTQSWSRLNTTIDEMRSSSTQNFCSIVLSCLRILYLLFLQTIGCVAWCFFLLVYWLFAVPPITHSLSIFFFIWETSAIFSIRSDAVELMAPEDQNGEEQLGFGQIVALTLLIGPVIANAEKWFEAFRSWSNPARPSQPEEIRQGIGESQATRETIVALQGAVQK